jgi:precorrin-6Y C5,15-methyltransferase (decarboxylating)
LTQILTFCQQKLNEQGKVVLALATIENIGTCLHWFKENKWNYSFQEIHISRTLPIGTLTRLNPLNPIMLIEATPFSD